MARVTAVRELASCLDSAPVREVELDCRLTTTLMRQLQGDGRLQYFPHFPRPLFRIEHPSRWVLQGIIGNRTLRVTFSSTAVDTAMEELSRLIEG